MTVSRSTSGRPLIGPYVCVCALVLWAEVAWALEPRIAGYVHRAWTIEQGLSQNLVLTLLVSRDGYLWVGGGNGLQRFDGLTFTLFDMANTPAFRSNWILSLHEAPDGTLWIGTAKGLVRYRAGVFMREEGERRFSDEVFHIMRTDRDGRVIAASAERLYRREPSGRWSLLPIEGLTEAIAALMVDRRGALWIATSGRLLEWQGRTVRALTARDGVPDAVITALSEDGAGRIWIGTERGLAHLEPSSGAVVAETGPLAHLRVFRLFLDRDHVLWIGAHRQLATRMPDGQTTVSAIGESADDDWVSAIAQDAAGQVWYGLGSGTGGLHRLTRHRVANYGRGQGLPCDNVGPVTAGPDGTLWFATYCAEGRFGVLKNGRVRTFPDAPRHISALLMLPNEELLIGTAGGRLFQFVDGRFRTLSGPFRLHLTYIRVLYRDDEGALWVGMQEGLARYQDGQWRTWRKEDGLASNDVRAIVAGPRQTLWLGMDDGVSRYENGRFSAYGQAQGVPPGEVRALHLDAEGALWIGTKGGGLARLKDDRVTRYGSYGGLLEASVHRIIEDDRGDLWLSGDHGIRRVSRSELSAMADGQGGTPRVDIFDTADGMKSAECNGMGQPAGSRTRDGAIWFPSQGGLVRIDPTVARVESPLPVAIESVRVNGVEQPLAQAITVPPGVRDLEVRYSAPALSRPEQVHFRYRLFGRDDTWLDVGRQRIVHFASLAPGDYRFQVTARSSAGAWSDTGATIRLVLQPHFYQRLSFKLAVAVVLLLAAAIGVWGRLLQHRRGARALEAVVAERTGELRTEREGLQQALRELHGAKTDLEGAHTHLLATFNQLRVGVILVDTDERVRFISEATRRLLHGAALEEPIGQPIARVLPIGPDGMAAVLAQIRAPQPGVRVTTALAPGSGRRYFAEIEVQHDPAHPGQRVLYLYDVTETFELRRALHAGARGAAASLLGDSIGMRAVRHEIAQVAGLDTTVVIEGETGTGKELVARAIHEASPRKHRPFVAINCAGLTESILASQLFGHRRGAFTGAVDDHVGLFEAANGGTLLLDEIGDMPLSVQTHLLRVLQEREILRLGDTKPRAIDVRVLAATHRDLEADVAQGRFREDLLYRIRVVRLHLPPLRQRSEDIPLLAAAFLQQARLAHDLQVEDISREAIEHLQAQAWPGNVRQLKATIEGAAIRAQGPVLKLGDVLSKGLSEEVPPVRGPLPESERRVIIEALRTTGGNRTAAARLLRVARSTLYRRLAQLEAEGTELPPDPSLPSSDSDPVQD